MIVSIVREHDISVAFPDDAVDQRRLGIKRIKVTQGLSRVVYLNPPFYFVYFQDVQKLNLAGIHTRVLV